ncbi:MAG: M1 family peptidase, partial [Chitinophagaceae bacterium]
LRDFYWKYDRGIVAYDSTAKIATPAVAAPDVLSEEEAAKYADVHLYEVTFSNKGGLVMPLIVEFTFEDGTKEVERISAQIWRKNEQKVTKLFMTRKKATSIKLDPMRETADIDEKNNTWPSSNTQPSKFAIFKSRMGGGRGQSAGGNAMQALQNK